MKHWQTVTLEQVTAGGSAGLRRGPFGGAIKKESFVQNGYKIYEQKHAIYGDFSAGSYFISEQRFRELKGFELQPDDLIVSCSGTLGRVAIAPAAVQPGIINQALLRIRPNRNLILPKFLKLMLETRHIRSRIFGSAGGSAIKNVRPLGEVRQSSFRLPPLSEQNRIVAILDAAEALREKRRQAIAKLDSLAQSIFLEIFGDPMGNPRKWPMVRLGDLATKFSDGPFGSNLKTNHYKERGVRVIRLQNIGVWEFVDSDKVFIAETHFEELSKHTCKPGDILIGTLGDPNLRACIQPAEIAVALNKADCVQMRVDPMKADPVYVCALINQPSTLKMAQGKILGQTRLRISMGRLRELSVPLPPLNLQNAYAERLTISREIKATQFQSLLKINSLFLSLQQRAFRGEL